MTTSDSIDQIATALVAVQSEIADVVPTASNSQLGNTYATLADVLESIRPILTKHGMAIIQCPGMEHGLVTMVTRLVHTSGQWIEGLSAAPPAEPTERQARSISPAQIVAAAGTLLRRQAATAMVGIAQADNDGNAGGRDANAVHDLGIGTTPEAAAEASPQGEGAAAPAPSNVPADIARKQNLQSLLMDEFARLGVEPDAVKANCQKLAGVDTIFQLTVDQLETALDGIRKIPA